MGNQRQTAKLTNGLQLHDSCRKKKTISNHNQKRKDERSLNKLNIKIHIGKYKPERVPIPITKVPTRVLRVTAGPKEAILSAILLGTAS